MGARPSEAFVESVRAGHARCYWSAPACSICAAREVACRRHQMLPDSRGARLRIDDDILDDGERLQRMTEMRNDNHVTGADDFARDLGDEDGVIAIAREAIECRRELRPRELASSSNSVDAVGRRVPAIEGDRICARAGFVSRKIASDYGVSYDGGNVRDRQANHSGWRRGRSKTHRWCWSVAGTSGPSAVAQWNLISRLPHSASQRPFAQGRC